MKSIAPSKTPSAQRPTFNAQLGRRVLLLLFSLLFAFASLSPLNAQVGNDNPSGPAGIFNGNLEVGVDPYTGNAGPRSTVDISIAGAVTPLALVRTYNSRDGIGTHFGYSGWRHSYEWSIDQSGNLPSSTFPPAAYVVNFPDGRREIFRFVSWDCGGNPYTCYYRVCGYQCGVESSAGVRDRFQQIDPQNNNFLCYLIMPDGSKVEFQATRHHPQNNVWYYTYLAQALIDPYGLRTTISWANGRISRVTEPAGRYLQFTYRTNPSNSPLIDYVTGSDGRVVKYNYVNSAYPPGTTPYMELNNVTYYGQINPSNPEWTANYKFTAPNDADNANGIPLLWTADEPMYAGVMKRIAYEYKTGTNLDGSTVVYGQIYKVRYWDGTAGHEASGPVVSTLDITASNARKETRGDTKWRTFTYGDPDTQFSGHLLSCTDFLNHISASQTYDDKMYINSVTDRNNHRTDYTLDPLTGNVTQIQFPLTPGDTPGQGNTRPTVNYTYTNNYYLHTIQGENGQITNITRDGNNRATRIDYPDGGYETFSYAGNSFGEVTSHRMTTGGTETFTYDARGLKQTYRNPSNASGNPTARYQYDTLDRVTDITDVLGSAVGDGNHSTSFTYNNRGQVLVTTLPRDPNDNVRHTVTNVYNPDGTLQSKTDQLSHVTNYTYDDYRRLKSVTPPDRNDGTGLHTTYFYYDANGSGDDYRFTDSNVTWVVLSSGKKTKTVYDDNRRKSSVTVAYGTADAATTSYGHDNVGNITSVTNPLNHSNTNVIYDERNRPSSVSVGGQTATVTYDTSGRKKSITRPNGQVLTHDTFDAMNRVTQQTATQSPDPAATTKYAYTPAGLLYTMQDPRLVATNSSEKYTYTYDNMGRKTQVQYPLDSYNVRRTEQWSYDTVGRLYQFTNRNSKIQTFTYDALNRMTGFSWNDGGTTPSVSFGYDVASRLTSINNANANITRAYFNDNLLQLETESITGGSSKTVTYSYNADGNRASTQYPDNYTFNYTYTGRNQLQAVTNYATFGYDTRGNLTTRTPANGRQSTYAYDNLDRVTQITHSLNGTTRTFDYDYDSVGNRKWTKHEGGYGDVFGYDLADQVIAVLLDVSNPDTTPVGDPTITYDGSGNRSSFAAYEWLETYTVNNLNQYTGRGLQDNPMDPRPTPTPRPSPTPPPHPSPTPTPGQQAATYDYNGNMTTGFDGSTYIYDAQNRLLSATVYGVTMTFTYDGLNRQVSRAVTPPGDGPESATAYSVWDGWDLIEEYYADGTIIAAYLYGAGGLIKNLTSGNHYYQDGSGSTSHLTDATGHLLEWYRYDLQGTPIFYDANNNQLWTSAYNVRHLFTGQQWYSGVGLYDLRNRFYSPDIGRFLQPDPIGFWGDPSNLYRYCGNNPLKWSDPMGEDVGLVGFQVSAGSFLRGSYSFQLGYSIDGWNPLNWGVGYASTYVPFTEFNTNAYSFNASLISTYSPNATSISNLQGWGGIAGVDFQVGPFSAELGASNLLNGPYAVNTSLGFGEAFVPFGAYVGADRTSTGSISIGDMLGSFWNGLGQLWSTGDGQSYPPPGGTTDIGPAPPGTATVERVIVTATFLDSVYKPYWGYLPTTNTTNWAGGIAGPGIISTWDTDSTYSGTLNFGDVGRDMYANPVGAMEPGLGCFAAGTPVLMADGTEKPIETIQAGDAILAWNDETRQVFSTRVVRPLHHEQKMQTLFDMELEDGRKFTVNNNHPMYVIEDDEFILTRELAARFANGEAITLQNNKNQPVKVASMQMRRERCKVYNLQVEGQGKNGHTYYAGGILVHNVGRARFK